MTTKFSFLRHRGYWEDDVRKDGASFASTSASLSIPVTVSFTPSSVISNVLMNPFRSFFQKISTTRSLSRVIWIYVGAPTSEQSRIDAQGKVKELTAKETGEREKDLEDKKKCLRLLVAFVVSRLSLSSMRNNSSTILITANLRS